MDQVFKYTENYFSFGALITSAQLQIVLFIRSLCSLPTMIYAAADSVCHDLARWLSHYLYFFSFLFLLSWTHYIEGSVGKCHIVTVSYYMTSHNGSHDRHGKVMHRPCSSCISSIENLMETLSSSLCQLLNKEQLALFQLGV